MVAKQKELRKRLGLHEFIKFLQSYSDGTGDYTFKENQMLKKLIKNLKTN